MLSKENKLPELLDIDRCIELVEKCPKDEVVILLPNWSIYARDLYNDGEPDAENWDLEELETILNCGIYVSQYNDLIADPHGVFED